MIHFAVLAEGTNMSSIYTIIMLVVMLLIFYFFLIRPQKKQEKETNAMRNSLMVGDEITTIGGIIGRVVSIKDETCVIETSRDCTKIRILKSAVKSVDVPVSATKGYVAPAVPAPADDNSQTEQTDEQASDKPAEAVINGEKKSKSRKKR